VESDVAGDPYPWYEEVVDGSLQQGDLLDQVPLVELQPPYDLNALQPGQRPKVKVRPASVIVLTQSCDLEAGKVDNVLICPHFLPGELSGIEELRSPKGRKRINQGMVVSVYLLPPCNVPGLEQGQRVVNFRQLATVPFGLAVAIADAQRSRIRLVTPYREHLAQALARFMERVGLPVNYPDI
jgi:hypothetical protein